jgi:hypothetical protein
MVSVTPAMDRSRRRRAFWLRTVASGRRIVVTRGRPCWFADAVGRQECVGSVSAQTARPGAAAWACRALRTGRHVRRRPAPGASAMALATIAWANQRAAGSCSMRSRARSASLVDRHIRDDSPVVGSSHQPAATSPVPSAQRRMPISSPRQSNSCPSRSGTGRSVGTALATIRATTAERVARRCRDGRCRARAKMVWRGSSRT